MTFHFFYFTICLEHCPDIDAPSNGRVHTSRGFARPRKSTFSCNARYRLEGQHVLHCLPNGQWEQVKPTCQGMGKIGTTNDMLKKSAI